MHRPLLCALLLASLACSGLPTPDASDAPETPAAPATPATPEVLAGHWELITDHQGQWVRFQPCDAATPMAEVTPLPDGTWQLALGGGHDAEVGVITAIRAVPGGYDVEASGAMSGGALWRWVEEGRTARITWGLTPNEGYGVYAAPAHVASFPAYRQPDSECSFE